MYKVLLCDRYFCCYHSVNAITNVVIILSGVPNLCTGSTQQIVIDTQTKIMLDVLQ
jgi:hypothetical protein